MATVDTHTERRHIPDRRVNSTSTTRVTSKRLATVDWIVLTLLLVGGLNWGLIGLFSFDLVAAIFGTMSLLTRLIYILVGLAAIYAIYTSSKLAGRKR